MIGGREIGTQEGKKGRDKGWEEGTKNRRE